MEFQCCHVILELILERTFDMKWPNACLHTSAGKTHTMSGSDVTDLAGRGINFRTLDDLFAINAQRASDVRPILSFWALIHALLPPAGC